MNNSILSVHVENKELIKKHDIKKDQWWKLKKQSTDNYYLTTIKVSCIHGLYGWLTFNNIDTNTPQKVSDFLKLYKKL